jgi:hypothetical protein
MPWCATPSQKSPRPTKFQYLLKEQIFNTTYVVAAKHKGNGIMATDKQFQANRRNAKRSTGPRTLEGKARSRLNSRKHGLTAKMLIIVGECADDFDQLRGELLEGHDARTPLECELVERLAGILWRLRRVPFFEAAILDARHSQTSNYRDYDETDEEEEKEEDEEEANWQASIRFGHALINDARYSDTLGKLTRHEAMLMNAFTKTLQMLLLLQDKRSNTESEPVMVEAVALPSAA